MPARNPIRFWDLDDQRGLKRLPFHGATIAPAAGTARRMPCENAFIRKQIERHKQRGPLGGQRVHTAGGGMNPQQQVVE